MSGEKEQPETPEVTLDDRELDELRNSYADAAGEKAQPETTEDSQKQTKETKK